MHDISYEAATIKGAWDSHIQIDDSEIWNLKKSSGQNHCLPVPNPLFSDCCFREDLLWLKKGKIELAESWKQWLEDQ